MPRRLRSTAPSTAVARMLAALTYGVARLRRGPALHGRGVVHVGSLDLSDPAALGLPVLNGGFSTPVVVRFSRSLGLPSWLPDVFGLGVRIPTAFGEQHLLLDTCGSGPISRHLPVPRRNPHAAYGTLVAHALGAGRGHVAVFPAPGHLVGDLSSMAGTDFGLAVATPRGPWRTVGTLSVTRRADDQTTRMRPDRTAIGIRPNPWWSPLRVAAYAASRRAQEVSASRGGSGLTPRAYP